MAAATSVTSRRRNRSPSAPRTVARLRVDCLSDDDDAANNRVVVQVPRPAPLLNGARRPFIEVFAGSCHLSDAFSKLGYQTFPIDVKISTQHDLKLGSHFVMDVISKLEAKTGLKPYIHFAPPCSTYSQARYPRIRSSACPGGLPASQLTAHDRTVLKYANKITHNTFHAMRELSRKGYPVTLEQPSGSLMLKLKIFKTWACESGAVPTVLDYCQFGMPYRKRTCLWSSPGAFLTGLARKCPGNHDHKATLSGWSVHKESRCPTSRGCSAYPPELCDEWARVFSLHAF